MAWYAFLDGMSPVQQTFLCTLYTWGMTGVGAAAVGFARTMTPFWMRISFGSAAGIMVAAAFFSLLQPAEMAAAEQYGSKLAAFPLALGFFCGFVAMEIMEWALQRWSGHSDLSDHALPSVADSSQMNVLMSDRVSYDRLRNSAVDADHEQDLETPSSSNMDSNQRLVDDHPASASGQGGSHSTWHRAFRIVVSISLHNIPEGMVVGVAFAAASAGATTLGAAATLAVGIGLQNVPEGAAVSLPLRRLGYSRWWSFFFGQLSGALEVLGGVMGAAVVSAASTILPFALSFAAAIMLVVVVRELLPDAVNEENKVTGVHSFVAGFLLMMVLDVALS